MDYRLENSNKSIDREKASGVPRASGVVLPAPDAPALCFDGLKLKGVARGLSYMPYKTTGKMRYEKYEVTAYDGASLLAFKRVNVAGKVAQVVIETESVRGVVSGFSTRARARFIQQANKIKHLHLTTAQDVTLTYPRNFPGARDSKRDLKVFKQRLLRAFPELAGLWKLELQKRGAPHYHLMLFGLRAGREEWTKFRLWVALNWYEVVGSGDIMHWQAGTSVNKVKNVKGFKSYLGKYLAKDVVFEDAPGRCWGVIGSIEQYEGDAVVFDASGDQVAQLWRVADTLRVASARQVKNVDRRRVAVGRARRRRDSIASRWYVCPVDTLMRYFLEGVLRS